MLWSAMAGEVEHFLLALPAKIQIAIGDQELVAQSLGLRDDQPVGIDDAGTADQSGTILVARLGDADGPRGIHVCVGLCDQSGVEGAQRRILQTAAIGIVGG